MNILFFGSSHFAAVCLEPLLSLHTVSCVVTQPDKKQGRGLHIGHTAVKDLAVSAHRCVFQPLDINSPESINHCASFKPDLLVVVSYGQKLSSDLLGLPARMPINAHASLLPAYRGAAPIQWAIANGEKTSGVTIMRMVERMDAGPILMQNEVSLSTDETFISLENKLAGTAAKMLIDTINGIQKNSILEKEQDIHQVSFAPKLKKTHGLVNWNLPAEAICDRIRAFLLWPGSHTCFKGIVIKITRATVCAHHPQTLCQAGTIIALEKEGMVVVAAGNSQVLIREIQPEGKRIMSAHDFLSGHKVGVGDRFDCTN